MTAKGLLLAGAGAFALFGTSGEARAQWAVECVNCTNELTEILRHGETIGQWVKQLQAMQQQYAQLVQTYQAIAHLPDAALQQLAGQLNVQQFRVPLPNTSGALNTIMNGTGLGQLGGLGQQYLNQNRVYAAPGTDAAATQMAASANSVAGVQAMLDQLYQSAAGRAQALQAIEGQLAAAPDAKATADLTARMQAEQTYLQAHLVQAQALQTWQAAQVRSDELRRQETRRCYIDAVLNDLQSGTSGRSSGDDCGLVNPGTSGTAIASGNSPTGAPVVPATYTYPPVTGGAGGNSAALDNMMGQSWGATAASNAQALGVNPTALAGTCVLESNCQNVAARPGSTVSGAFQMTDATYNADLNAALASNPELASQATGGKMDPGTQSIAAAQDLKTAALNLQQRGISNPTVMDVRGYYNFGARYGAPLAQASNDQLMGDVLSGYSADTLAKNGVTPGMTVGQWRAGVSNKLGTAATAPVLSNVQRG